MHELGRQFDAIAVVLGIARRSGAPGPLLAAAEGALEELAVIAGMADSRRVATFQRGLRIQRLLAQGLSRPDVCERLNISTDAYHRALRELRESRNCLGVEPECTQSGERQRGFEIGQPWNR